MYVCMFLYFLQHLAERILSSHLSSSRSKSLLLQLQFPGDCSGTRLLNHLSEHRRKSPCSQQSLISFTDEVLLLLTSLSFSSFLILLSLAKKLPLTADVYGFVLMTPLAAFCSLGNCQQGTIEALTKNQMIG